MAIETEDEARDRAEYEQAFAGDTEMGGAAAEQDDDGEQAQPEQGGEQAGEGVTVVIENDAGGGEGGDAAGGDGDGVDGEAITRQQEGDAGGEAGGASGGDGTGEEPSSGMEVQGDEPSSGSAATTMGGTDLDLSDVPSDEQQAARSWQGRLKARETELTSRAADLDAREQKLMSAPPAEQSAALENVGDTATNPDMASAANEMAERVEAGDISAKDAIAQLSEDFGEPFIKMITAVATEAVNGRMGELQSKLDEHGKKVDEAIGSVANNADRAHFQRIHEDHPDAFQIAEDPGFKKWAADNGKQAIVDGGSARQISKMLTEYKASKTAAATPAQQVETAGPSADEVAAASAVPSRGIAAPPRPDRQASKDDYEGAWKQA